VFVFRFAIRHFVQLRVHGSRQDLKQRMLSETQESQSGNELEHARTILGDFFSWLMSLILRSAEPCVLTPSSTFLLMCAMVYCAWTQALCGVAAPLCVEQVSTCSMCECSWLRRWQLAEGVMIRG
jgi:hypothetical protein